MKERKKRRELSPFIMSLIIKRKKLSDLTSKSIPEFMGPEFFPFILKSSVEYLYPPLFLLLYVY